MKTVEDEGEWVSDQVSRFCNDNKKEEDTAPSSSNRSIFANYYSLPEKREASGTLTEEQMKQECLQIREYIKNGKPANIEIDFSKGTHISKDGRRKLKETVIKAISLNDESQEFHFFHIGKDEIYDFAVFIGGDNLNAFLLIKEEDSIESVTQLSEFYLLSIFKKNESVWEAGLMTSYSWVGGYVSSGTVTSVNLGPIEVMFMSDWLRKKTNANQEQKDIPEDNDNE